MEKPCLSGADAEEAMSTMPCYAARPATLIDLDQRRGGPPWHDHRMEDRAETLRRRIALHRRLLNEGVSADVASRYLRDIISATIELEQIIHDRAEKCAAERRPERET